MNIEKFAWVVSQETADAVLAACSLPGCQLCTAVRESYVARFGVQPPLTRNEPEVTTTTMSLPETARYVRYSITTIPADPPPTVQWSIAANPEAWDGWGWGQADLNDDAEEDDAVAEARESLIAQLRAAQPTPGSSMASRIEAATWKRLVDMLEAKPDAKACGGILTVAGGE
jgi:hypothetical protein